MSHRNPQKHDDHHLLPSILVDDGIIIIIEHHYHAFRFDLLRFIMIYWVKCFNFISLKWCRKCREFLISTGWAVAVAIAVALWFTHRTQRCWKCIVLLLLYIFCVFSDVRVIASNKGATAMENTIYPNRERARERDIYSLMTYTYSKIVLFLIYYYIYYLHLYWDVLGKLPTHKWLVLRLHYNDNHHHHSHHIWYEYSAQCGISKYTRMSFSQYMWTWPLTLMKCARNVNEMNVWWSTILNGAPWSSARN